MEEGTCEKIIHSLDSVIKKDPLLDEFDVIESSCEANRSPVVHINHKLGLKSWCVKYVYMYSHSSILHHANVGGYDNAAAICRWTQFCVLLSPEMSTFWNIRRKLVKKGIIKTEEEFFLTKLVLSRKPKSIEVFQYRRWLYSFLTGCKLNQNPSGDSALNNNFDFSPNLREKLTSEFEVCKITANKSPNNYHSWNHRLWVLETFSNLPNLEDLYRSEYQFSKDWISLHVSEYSGIHYRTKILENFALIVEKGNVPLNSGDLKFESISDIYTHELKLNNELFDLYPGHESLFYHRRYILQNIFKLCNKKVQKHSSPSLSGKRPCIETIDKEWTEIVQNEIKNINKYKLVSKYNQFLCDRHLKWINNMLTF